MRFMSPVPLEKINMAEVLFFKRLVKCRYLGMVLLYIYRRELTYKQEINQDLKISDRSVDEAIAALLADKMIKGTKSQNGRIGDCYSITPAGVQAAKGIEICVRMIMQQLPRSA
jgi:predicted DNA-binding transcriptional regulator